MMRFETHQLDKALGYFERAIELDPFHREAHNQLAYAYNDLGRFDRAMWAVNKYIEIAPDEANAYDSRGEILAANGKLDEAIASYEQAHALQPDFGRSCLADLYVYRGLSARADSLFRAMATDASERTRASGRLALTRIPRYQGRFKEALSLLATGVATDRMELGASAELAEKLWIRVLIHDLLGTRGTIVDDLQQAVTIAEAHEARSLYAGLYRAFLVAEWSAQGDQARADSLMSAIALTVTKSGYPDSTSYWLASAFTHFKLQQYETAALFWQKALAPEPLHFPSLLHLGLSYLGAGQLGDAVSTLEKASRVYDETRRETADMGVLCHYHLGRAYEASGWADKATTQFETFLNIWRDADPGIAEIEDAKRRLTRLRGAS
jgi:tetratricopeptide (TPR) repeat protein